MNVFLGINIALWFACIIMLAFFIYRLYKISNSKTMSETLIRNKFYITLLGLIFIFMILMIIISLIHYENEDKQVDQYPKIVVYDNEREYKNQLGTEIDVNYEGSHLTHIKRTEAKPTPDSNEVMVVITLGFEEDDQ